jgi:EcsC protein family
VPLPPLDASTLVKTLDWAYARAVEGGVGLDSAERLAETYAAGPGTVDEQAQRLVRWQVTMASTAGFVSGFGGLMTMPVSVPVNLAAVLFIQLRLVAGVAALGRHDVRSEQVRTLAFACLSGKQVTAVAQDMGLLLGAQLSGRALRSVSFEVIKKVNRVVQARLLAEFGGKGIAHVGRVLPVAGGLISGSLDGASTYAVGRAARSLFTQRNL